MKKRKKPPKKNTHHRRPKAQGGDNSPRNIKKVPVDKHECWSKLFPGHMTPEEIAKSINRTWLDPDFMFICVRRKE